MTDKGYQPHPSPFAKLVHALVALDKLCLKRSKKADLSTGMNHTRFLGMFLRRYVRTLRSVARPDVQ